MANTSSPKLVQTLYGHEGELQCSTVQCSAVQYSAVQCNAVPHVVSSPYMYLNHSAVYMHVL
jgi:hypothetical protein